ncbi:hypothetical protein [Chishuiella changwenlii]|uniref:hypothetical protein n=1 Tax=Chishuiella changwenlii TaxID=1434701 RepID=UPI002FD96481
MKSCYLLLGSMFLAIQLNAQVGVNTENPNATLEIASSPSNLNQVDGLIPPKLSGDELKAKDALYEEAQTGSIIFATSAVGSPSPKTVNITAVGYYYFDGTVWQKMSGNGGSGNAFNGLTLSGENVKLGGTLIDPTTTIATSANNTLRLSGLQEGNADTGKYLVLDELNNIQQVDNITTDLSIPTPAIFSLSASMGNFLNGVSVGGLQTVNFVQQKNAISGLTYDQSTSTVSFQPGTYQITFVFEATHNVKDCTVSSYFVDFPIDIVGTTNRQRIHSTASHNQGFRSDHGGTVSYTTSLTAPRTWQMRLGRGQSGNCIGAGMTLLQKSTQVEIFRLGD